MSPGIEPWSPGDVELQVLGAASRVLGAVLDPCLGDFYILACGPSPRSLPKPCRVLMYGSPIIICAGDVVKLSANASPRAYRLASDGQAHPIHSRCP